MRRTLSLTLILLLAAAPAWAASKEEERLQNCATVLTEILNIPDNIPQDLLDKAECIVVMPSVKKFALGWGARGGRGALVCRTGEKKDGPWGAPVMMELGGASVGFQIGGEATDFVLLVMNPSGAEKLLQSKVTLGGNLSVAGGPKGRTAEAATDAQMSAEILTYSRTKGLFAGASLEGASLTRDEGANKKIHGTSNIDAKKTLFDPATPVPAAGRSLVDLLNQKSPKNVSAN
jgi:lipid-binding SYLF domain-containing protein